MQRASGILMHISTLWGSYSSGNFGKCAREFIDFLSECGFSYWQVLPFGITDDCASPYKSYSAFAGNPVFIDPQTLCDRGLLTSAELESIKQKTPYVCEYDFIRQTRYGILRLAASRADNREEIERFVASDRQISDLCMFMALKSSNGGREWYEWTCEIYDPEELFMWKFIQYEFFREWEEIRNYAASRGISIIGDLPIYVSADSADVWANREQFLLDADGRPSEVAGVPPDYFSADGQLWGNPLYNWKQMKKDGFEWWSGRINHALTIFDGVRIDHFRGFESYWSVPRTALSAREGRWIKGGGKPFVRRLRELAGDRLIIAEDLGDITPEVSELVRYSGFPGMRVLQFAFLGDRQSVHLPHNYINNCVAYTGTHDNNTLLGYIWELDAKTRKEVLEYCGYTSPDWDRGYGAIIRTMLASHAGLVIFPIQDILGYGSDTRMNRPGIAEGNWRIRFTKEQIDSIDRRKYYEMNRLYGRI